MTYVGLSSVFLLVSLAVLAVAVAVRRPDRRWWTATGLTVVALLALTAVFDNIMIAADLFRYEDAAISGVRLGLAPIEDFAWPLAVVALLPAVWMLLPGDDGADPAGRRMDAGADQAEGDR